MVDADTVLSRQTSRYADARMLMGAARNRAVDVLCVASCVREPCWDGAEGGGMPCPEPCSVFVALAQAASEWDPAETADPASAEIGFADFAQPGNEIRRKFLATDPN